MHRVSIARLPMLPLVAALCAACDLPPKEDDGTATDGSETDDPTASSTSGTSGTSGDGSDGSDGSGGSDTGGLEPTERSVDIIFVVDNSGSMGEEQAKLASGIGTLVTALDAAVPPVNYRIAVTTTDNGNPWCQGTTPEAGEFRATSCRTRTNEFVFNGAQEIDVTDEACLNVCDSEDLGLAVPWIEVDGATGTTNLPGGGSDVEDALSCLLPQGIDGCGFEQPLESLALALEKATLFGEANNGFLRPGALLAVAVVTDEVDCSYNPEHETIFLPEGNRVFWSDLDFPAPTSAVCWNAGTQCTGASPYDCQSADLDVDGNATASDADAVLRPLSKYIDVITAQAAYMVALNGVSSDGSVLYADSPATPDFEVDFGIGPGCSSASSDAVPPVRIREVVEAVTGPGNQHSICSNDYSPALTEMAEGILSRLP